MYYPQYSSQQHGRSERRNQAEIHGRSRVRIQREPEDPEPRFLPSGVHRERQRSASSPAAEVRSGHRTPPLNRGLLGRPGDGGASVHTSTGRLTGFFQRCHDQSSPSCVLTSHIIELLIICHLRFFMPRSVGRHVHGPSVCFLLTPDMG